MSKKESVVVAKFGGSAIGNEGDFIPIVVNRIKQMSKKNKIITVFSAPIISYDGKSRSMTDVAIDVGRKYAASKPIDIEILRRIYDIIAKKYVSEQYIQEFNEILDKFYSLVKTSLNNARDNKRFTDVTRSRILAYSGEITMSYLMDYIMKSNGIKSDHVRVENWPIITDDNFEGANFMLSESRQKREHLLDLINKNDVISIGGFIGKTMDGLETTYERGGSDRTAADIAIILHDLYDTEVDLEKDNVVLSADPKIVKDNLDYVKYLSYNEATLAGMFGMKILDPVAIKEIDDNNLDIPIVITSISDPSKVTIIRKSFDESVGDDDNLLIKIVTGKRNCAIVRMESIAALYLVGSLEKEKQYYNFIKLSPYKNENIEITRILFLDADYVKKNEHKIKAYYPKTEFVYGRGVVTLIGDKMWKVSKIASTASSTVGDYDINILDLDAQEETSRILIIVNDSGDNVANAVKAIHSQRGHIHNNSNVDKNK